jgi:hypothetical protein
MIVATLTRDCNSGAYPALLRAGYVGGLIDLLAHRPLAWQAGYRQGARLTGSYQRPEGRMGPCLHPCGG